MNGTASALAILLALYHRERTGKATSTHSSLLNTATLTNSETLLRTRDGTLATYPRLNHDQTGLDRGYRMYDVAAGSVAIGALDERRPGALPKVGRVDADGEAPDAFRV